LIALVVSLFLERLARGSRNHASSSTIRARLRSWRTRNRSCEARPLISRSMANRTSMRLTASAAIGALLSRARSKNLRLPCAQHAASMIGPFCDWPRRAYRSPRRRRPASVRHSLPDAAPDAHRHDQANRRTRPPADRARRTGGRRAHRSRAGWSASCPCRTGTVVSSA
jgi:hypothetical protein